MSMKKSKKNSGKYSRDWPFRKTVLSSEEPWLKILKRSNQSSPKTSSDLTSFKFGNPLSLTPSISSASKPWNQRIS
jgi:hypothetical protein